MKTAMIVDNASEWQLKLPGVEVLDATDYLTNAVELLGRRALVVNLCGSYDYQRTGYYVSLLGAARGHRVLPDIDSLIDLSRPDVLQPTTRDLQSRINRLLHPLRSDRFELSIYFGRTLASRYEPIGKSLDAMFRAPLLRAVFERHDGVWTLEGITPIAWEDVPEAHHEWIQSFASDWLGRRARTAKTPVRAHLGILVDETDQTPPSDEAALRRFERAAKKEGIRTERLDRKDAHRIPSFDALFIRTTTSVGHFSYEFARRAESEGLAVIDDPRSIVRCSNKVFLAELLHRRNIPCPKTVIVHGRNRDTVADELGYPLVLKTPDGSFSRGVRKCRDDEELQRNLDEMLADSELLVAQQWLPTTFDWRIGILDGRPLYACRYHMAGKHWQIIRQSASGRQTSGRVESVRIEDVPSFILSTALETCAHIGTGLYGVDVKEHEGKAYLIEVNDNPNLDAGYEDAILGQEFYRTIALSFLERIEATRSKR